MAICLPMNAPVLLHGPLSDGLIAAAMVTQADGYAEREAALLMLVDKQQHRSRRITVGADKAYDNRQLSRPRASSTSRRTLARTTTTAAPTWTAGRRGTQAMRSA